MMISIMIPASTYPAFPEIMVKPANSPAEAFMNRLVMVAWKGVSPACRAVMPRVKPTDRYPRAIGIPSCIPFFSQNEFFVSIVFPTCIL